MTVLVWFGLRVALAASYLTLAVANPDVAGTLAFPYAGERLPGRGHRLHRRSEGTAVTTERRVEPQRRDRLSQIAEGYEE